MNTQVVTLSGPVVQPASEEAPKQIILFLHGLGADGKDLIDLAGPMQQLFPEALFVSPDAPQPCDMAPMGFQWFSLQDRDPEVLMQGARSAEPILNGFIDRLIEKFGVTSENIAVVGFSQGTMMALHALCRRPDPIAAVVGFSGGLVGPQYLASEAQSKSPICLIHGDADEVVPFAAMGMSEQALQENGFSVESHARPGLGHGIDMEGLQTAIAFLQTHLNAA
ncbi:MAG: alpha/beta hydrolase [Rickettsiales bacterium]|nr:alpha/beta hydrolase [Rickettsiales bacterium]